MKSIKAVIILLLISLSAFSQEESVDMLLDEFLFGKTPQDSVIGAILINEADINDLLDAVSDFKYIYLRSEFENMTYFSGQDIGIDQYNIANQVFYQGSKGLHIGIAGILYSGFDPKYNTTIVSAGYSNYIPKIKGLSLRAIYNRFFFAKNDSISENAFNSSLSFGTTYQYKNIGSTFDLSFLLGKDPSAQLSWDFFADFTLLRIGLFDKLKFVPELSLYAGNETVVSSQYIILPRYSWEIFSEKNTFGLMNTVLRLPLNLSYHNFDLTAGYNFNFPRIPGGEIKPKNTSFFNISAGYIFVF